MGQVPKHRYQAIGNFRLLKVGSINHSETIVQFIYLDSHQPFKEVKAAHPGLGDPMKRQRNIHQTTGDCHRGRTHITSCQTCFLNHCVCYLVDQTRMPPRTQKSFQRHCQVN